MAKSEKRDDVMHFLEGLWIEITKPGFGWDGRENISLPIGENYDTLKVLITHNRLLVNFFLKQVVNILLKKLKSNFKIMDTNFI